jgi:hypothetical protein
LKLPDCCVALAAHEVDAGAVPTLDERPAGAAARLGLSVRE